MKNFTSYLILLRFHVIIALLFLYACKGNSDNPAPAKKDLIIQNWQLIKLTANNATPYNDLTPYSFKFNADGTYQINSGESAITNSGTWAMNSNETKIILNSGSEELTIITLTAQQMILEYTSKNYKTGNVLWRFEFNKA